MFRMDPNTLPSFISLWLREEGGGGERRGEEGGERRGEEGGGGGRRGIIEAITCFYAAHVHAGDWSCMACEAVGISLHSWVVG